MRPTGRRGVGTEPRAVDAPIAPAEAALVDLDAAFRASNIDQVFDELDRELVGLRPVKTRIREIAALLLVARLREERGLSSDRPTLHMSFTGRPGTGKTTVALRMAKILQQLGYVRKGHLVVASRDDLVGQYVGHTAPKTKEAIKRAMGGVLFIDEAYYLYRPENERDYGQEAIEMLLQVMENQREDLVVILAGYRDRMDTFFHSNPGFHSRIAHHLDFPDYTSDELMAIADLMLTHQHYALDAASRQALREYLELRMGQPHFANARSVRNAVDRAKLRQANRLVRQGGSLPEAELTRLDAADIRQSRVFGAHRDGEAGPSSAATDER
ncbi:MAG: CbbX protein [Gemmatimonadales bacterium]